MRELKLADCTDPRDKIFASLGHATDVGPDQVAVDYGKNPVEVYVDVAQFALLHPSMQGLEVLSLVFSSADDASHEPLSETFEPRMPSWVLDWRYKVSIGRLVNSDRATEDGIPLYNSYPRSIVEACVCDKELEIKGYVANELRIETVTNIWDDGDPSSPLTAHSCVELDTSIRRSLVAGKHQIVQSRAWTRGCTVGWALVESQSLQGNPHDPDPEALNERDFMLGAMSDACYGK
ncbi:MAG: hypothetical protein Q9227_007778 [Pyrenula ochraceoflavens]